MSDIALIGNATETYVPDYGLLGRNTNLAIEKGLAEATWYTCPIPRDQYRKLLERRDGPAIRDTIIWFALLIGSAVCGYLLWQRGSWWAVVPFMIYAVIYASTSDSRWHESLHGTAFKTNWMNNILYEIASFMVMRESTLWRWSHTRHHSDTIIVGRDPEIAAPRPPKLRNIILGLFAIQGYVPYFKKLIFHASGRLTPEERTFVPDSEDAKIYLRARVYLLIYACAIGLAVYMRSILPLLFIGLPNLYGSWLMTIYGLTQHAGLAENVLDHRLNCRTVYMNPIHRYLYWNMGYHVEHHMFPLVPYHNLPKLHEAVKSDMPTPYPNLLSAWKEIIPAVLKQRRDPGFYIRRELPTPTHPSDAPSTKHIFTAKGNVINGMIEVCVSHFLKQEDVIRFDHDGRTYAIYRTADDSLYATDGMCTHGNAHLADGMVKGTLIECAKHNGRFDLLDGSPKRLPACVALRTFKAIERDGKIFLDLSDSPASCPAATIKTHHFRVVSNDNVATFIKELVLEPMPGTSIPDYKPGEYIQLDIPVYEECSLSDIAVSEPFASVWRAHHVFDHRAENPLAVRRNYSMTTNPATDKQLRFNVRIATPPRGQDCPAGVGSSYVFRLKPGDEVTAIGPFGDFHIKETNREMIYLGGGAGMAPLRSHLSHLFETQKTTRRVSYWYGARSGQELFYQDYFNDLANRFPNFTFHVALSEPQPSDPATYPTGFIHEVLLKNYLANHPNPTEIEFYLCGPPMMVQAAITMLDELGVPKARVAFDEF